MYQDRSFNPLLLAHTEHQLLILRMLQALWRHIQFPTLQRLQDRLLLEVCHTAQVYNHLRQCLIVPRFLAQLHITRFLPTPLHHMDRPEQSPLLLARQHLIHSLQPLRHLTEEILLPLD